MIDRAAKAESDLLQPDGLASTILNIRSCGTQIANLHAI